jgi:hypothetical protein
MTDVPMTIPDPIWDVLQEHRDRFPAPSGDEEPWRDAALGEAKDLRRQDFGIIRIEGRTSPVDDIDLT